jgi:hypothetical protein
MTSKRPDPFFTSLLGGEVDPFSGRVRGPSRFAPGKLSLHVSVAMAATEWGRP